MIERDDLRAGVAAGILTEDQAARMMALADSRRGARENLAPGDEPFELFRGFNEIFIVVGLVILSLGWTGVVTAMGVSAIRDMERFAIVAAVLTAAVLWLLSEYFIRRRRMVAPSILLTGYWAANAAIGFFFGFAEVFMVGRGDISSLPVPMALTTLALLLFWWRFRVPIALSGVALGVFAIAVTAAIDNGERIANPRDFFLLSGEGSIAWITLVLGLAVFAVAMVFDMSDPHRVTRRSANGFWLHVIAAPAIVNTVALSLIASDGEGRLGLLSGFLAVIAVVAIIIDRRSFLIAGVGYVVGLGAAVGDGAGIAMTILLLGVGLLLLGAFWERVRSVILHIAAPLLPLGRLPPSGSLGPRR